MGSVLKLMKLRVDDNTEAYFTIFERMVMVYGVERIGGHTYCISAH